MTFSQSFLDLIDSAYGLSPSSGVGLIVHTLDVRPRDLRTGSPTSLRFCDVPLPAENSAWMARLVPPTYSVSIAPSELDNLGRRAEDDSLDFLRFGATTVGQAAVLNADGDLNYLKDRNRFSFEGARAIFRAGAVGWDYETQFEQLFEFTVGRFHWDRERLIFELSGPFPELKQAAQTRIYESDSGVDDGVAGQRRPRVLGRAWSVPADLRTQTTQLYEVSDRGIQSLDEIREGGLAFSPGDVEERLDTGRFEKLGALPVKALSADVKGDNTGSGYVTTAADLILRLLAQSSPETVTNSASFSAHRMAWPQQCGIVVRDQTIQECIDYLLSPRSFAYPNRDAELCLGWVSDPAEATPDWTIPEEIVRSVRQIPSPAPSWRRSVAGRRRWSLVTDFLGAVEPRDQTILSREWTVREADSQGVRDLHADARFVRTISPFSLVADLLAEAEAQLKLFGEPLSFYEVELTAPTYRAFLGAVVNVTSSDLYRADYGLLTTQDGKTLVTQSDDELATQQDETRNLRVFRIFEDPAKGSFKLLGWGV